MKETIHQEDINIYTPIMKTGECYQTFQLELTPNLLKLFQKIKDEVMLPRKFYEASISPLPKPDKDIKRQETTDKYS